MDTASAEHFLSEFFVGSRPYPMYVQRWAPAAGSPTRSVPIILIHGGSHTGTMWTTAPNGEPGWVFLFMRQGWPVYVVDWPGVGRSGTWPESLTMGAGEIVAALVALLEKTGPAVLVGHSIGGGLSFKVAEERPALVRAVVALAPASVEFPNPNVPVAPLDRPVSTSREVAMQRFANSALFPKEAFDDYVLSLVPYSPRIRNAAVGAGDELKLDRGRLDVWKKVPVLFLAAEEDRTLPNHLSEETARVIGVPHTLLGRDWGMPGHGHLYVIEHGNAAIARRIQDWIARI